MLIKLGVSVEGSVLSIIAGAINDGQNWFGIWIGCALCWEAQHTIESCYELMESKV